ncbi:MAG: hypothetical protein KKC28_00845, partial [Verrucomicrobia bacterium]|nr:hypothetical protein [Verrucomicrobiota bacterium]
RLHVFPLRFLHHFLTPPFGSINYGATIPFCPPSFSLSGNIYCGAIRLNIMPLNIIAFVFSMDYNYRPKCFQIAAFDFDDET